MRDSATLPLCQTAVEATGPARTTFDGSRRSPLTFLVRAECLQVFNLAVQLRRARRVAEWQSFGLPASHVSRDATASRMAPILYVVWCPPLLGGCMRRALP
jgi:hypothetical protein